MRVEEKPKKEKILATTTGLTISAIACLISFVACSAEILTTPPTPGPVTPTVTVTQTETVNAPPVTVTATPKPAAQKNTPAKTGTALEALNKLPVKGRAPKTGYDRENFGHAWKDTDRNGCDTRNDILNRDLANKTYKPGTNNCVVLAGTLNDPYTGKTINFHRGKTTSKSVQIDHLVALSNAWQTGAQNISQDQRELLANDPLNLLAVDGPANQQKSDGDAATWLPPSKAFRCRYIARQIAIKTKYSLWVVQPEKDAMARVLSTCPTEPLP